MTVTDNTERPFFSVITVSYNPGQRLADTMASIIAQTCADYEVIVEDSLSSDGSLQAVPGDPRFRVFREKDRGIYDGMNRAAARARGRYLCFLNCGDRFYGGDTLEKVKESITGAGAAAPAVFYGSIYERKTGQLVSSKAKMDDFAVFRNVPNHQSCFYSADLFGERGFDLRYKVRGDYEHFLYCKYLAGAALIQMKVVIADYEGGGYSETKESRAVSAAEHREITGRYLPARKLVLYRLYLAVTLQPLREKLASDSRTAALYDRIKNRHYGLEQPEKGEKR